MWIDDMMKTLLAFCGSTQNHSGREVNLTLLLAVAYESLENAWVLFASCEMPKHSLLCSNCMISVMSSR
jgi:hypothetical protein